MNEKKYSIFELRGKEFIATGMSLDIALMFVESYAHKFYNVPLHLTIVEETDGET